MAKKWFTNGIEEKFIEETCCPPGFHKGRKPVSEKTRKKHSENNGIHKLSESKKQARALKISKTKQTRTQEEIDAETAKAKQTFIEHYGVDSPMKCQEIKEKLKNTIIENYGVDNIAKSADIKKKIKQTNLEKYGAENVFAADEIKEKIKATNLKKYGQDNYQKTEEARANAKKRYILNKDILIKISKQTKLEKYCDKNYDNQELASKTCIEKYGIKYFAQTDFFYQLAKKHYLAEDQYFDSLPELALYLYAITNDLPIERCPVKLSYELNGKIHYYFPDFKFYGKLIELKGDHFFNGDKMINPFDHTQDELYEAKHQCGLQNGVEFWRKEDYQQYIDWFNEHGFKKEDFEAKNQEAIIV